MNSTPTIIAPLRYLRRRIADTKPDTPERATAIDIARKARREANLGNGAAVQRIARQTLAAEGGR